MKNYLLLTLFALTLFSCYKDGCDDPTADNFDTTVNRNNGSCSYSTYVAFYKSDVESAKMIRKGASVTSLYINGNLVGTEPARFFFDNTPECKNTQLINTIVALGNQSSKGFRVTVKDDKGNEYLNRSYTFFANECALIELL